MPRAGFEPAIPVNQRPKTHALGRTATGMDCHNRVLIILLEDKLHGG